jgi:hypothetical protein
VVGERDESRHGLRIFISYRREDTAGYAGRIYDDLAKRFGDDQVFMDIDTIRPGSDFIQVITEALDGCDVVLAVIGRRWLSLADAAGHRRLDNPQDLVRVELQAALRRGITLIPLLVQGAEVPAREDLPEPLAGLAVKQAFDLSDRRWRADVVALVDELDRLRREKTPQPQQQSGFHPRAIVGPRSGRLYQLLGISRPGTTQPPPVAAQPPGRRGRRLLQVAAVSVLILMVTVVGFRIVGHNNSGPGGSTPSPSRPPTEPPVVEVGPASQVHLTFPYGVGLDRVGRIYIADSGNLRVRRVDADTISTIAGSGVGGNSGDGGPATQAKTTCHGLAIAADGAVLIAAIENNNIRKVDLAGTMSTLAGNGSRGYSGDGGPASQAQLNGPWDVDVGPDGAIYIADTGNHRIRRVDTSGRISTVAGTGTPGFGGDGGPATQAQLTGPRDVAVAGDGAFYIADGESHRVRRVDTSGRIATVAGIGTPGFGGDGGPATQAQLNTPHGVDVDNDENIYIADLYNNRIRRVDRTGIITTIAGTGTHGYSGDGGPATQAQLAYPRAVAVHTDGMVYIADINNHRIRKIDRGGTMTTAAGRSP